MSFRTNLQYLRAERHMTQEQLAMLLGVSRQSVTKWEAGRAYPEMDKLMKICQVFECTLDNLVNGDVSRKSGGVVDVPSELLAVKAESSLVCGEAGPVVASISSVPTVPVGPAVDVCGYDEYMVAFARKVSGGVSLIILGVAAAAFTDQVMHSGGIVLMSLFAFVAAGVALIVPAAIGHMAFVKEHPYVDDFYTAEQKAAARRCASIAIVAGIGLILLGVASKPLFSVESNVSEYGGTLMVALMAAGVGTILYWSMLWGRTDLVGYNKEWLESVDLSESELSQLDSQSRAAYLLAKDPQRRRASVLRTKACIVIMLLATMVSLVWLFVGSAVGIPAEIKNLFWLPWLVGGLCCGIAVVLLGNGESTE